MPLTRRWLVPYGLAVALFIPTTMTSGPWTVVLLVAMLALLSLAVRQWLRHHP